MGEAKRKRDRLEGKPRWVPTLIAGEDTWRLYFGDRYVGLVQKCVGHGWMTVRHGEKAFYDTRKEAQACLLVLSKMD